MKAEELLEVAELLKLIRSVPPAARDQIYMITQGAVILSNRTK